jgi:uncharacterized protein
VGLTLNAPRVLKATGRLVRVGCPVHDIGAYRLYDAAGKHDHANYVRHGFTRST